VGRNRGNRSGGEEQREGREQVRRRGAEEQKEEME
jgi:hypothetical protein